MMVHEKYGPRPLVFAPAAWLKWQYLAHAGPTEAAGFGLSAAEDPLYVEDVLVVRQRATSVTVGFDDAAVADLFDNMADVGIPPSRYARLWLHTHPGASSLPSCTDEDTFARVFGDCDWSVMAILGRTGQTYARLQFAAGPGASVELPTVVHWAAWPATATGSTRPLAELIAVWQQEYEALVRPAPLVPQFVQEVKEIFAVGAARIDDLLDLPFDPFPNGDFHAFE